MATVALLQGALVRGSTRFFRPLETFAHKLEYSMPHISSAWLIKSIGLINKTIRTPSISFDQNIRVYQQNKKDSSNHKTTQRQLEQPDLIGK